MEIKVRVWDSVDKEMTSFDRIRILPSETMLCQLFEEKRYNWMLFTNQKDLNDKEVYEGDIFREEIETDKGDIRVYKVVMWIKERSAFYLVNVSHFNVLIDNDCSSEAEFSWLFDDAVLYDFSIDVKHNNSGVIGNIYQNKKLLNS